MGTYYSVSDLGLIITASGLTVSVPGSGLNNILSKYYSGTHNETWTGPFASSPSSNVSYEIIGDTVHVSISKFDSAAGGSLSIISSSIGLPTQFRPASDRLQSCFIDQVGSLIGGTLAIRTSGAIEIGIGSPSNSGTLSPFSIIASTNGAPVGIEFSYSLSNS